MRLDILLHRAVIDASHLERLVDEILLPAFLEKTAFHILGSKKSGPRQ
jgi:hypothetical protein